MLILAFHENELRKSIQTLNLDSLFLGIKLKEYWLGREGV
jgi:hypothetical protein